MSLLNEALKRADTDKSSNTFDPSTQLPDLTPADDGGGPSRLRLPLLAAVVLAVGAGAAWMIAHTGPDAVPVAATADQQSTEATHTNTPPPPPAAFLHRPEVTKPAAEVVEGEPAGPAEKPLAAAKPDQPEPAKPVEVAMADTREPEPAAKPVRTPVRPAPAEDEDEQPVAPMPQPAPAAERHEERRPAPAEPAPRPAAQPRVDSSKFKLTGIMEGPDGKQAIINGQFITVGQIIDGATVVDIGTQSAELKAGDVTFRLRFE